MNLFVRCTKDEYTEFERELIRAGYKPYGTGGEIYLNWTTGVRVDTAAQDYITSNNDVKLPLRTINDFRRQHLAKTVTLSYYAKDESEVKKILDELEVSYVDNLNNTLTMDASHHEEVTRQMFNALIPVLCLPTN